MGCSTINYSMHAHVYDKYLNKSISLEDLYT